MIVWLNGAFGAGKTTTAAELLSLVPNARQFDPETVGYMLRSNMADHPVEDFQHWPPWRPLVVAALAEVARYTGQHLVAPQAVLDQLYLDEIFAGLRASGLDVFHVVLDADEDELRGRIEGSGEAKQWRLDRLVQYRSAREWMREAADLVVDTTTLGPGQVAYKIAGAFQVFKTTTVLPGRCLRDGCVLTGLGDRVTMSESAHTTGSR